MKANFRCKEPFGSEPPAVGGGGVSLCGPVAKASGLECSFSDSASASPVGPSPPWTPPCWLSSPPAAPDKTQRQTDEQVVSWFSSSPAAPCALLTAGCFFVETYRRFLHIVDLFVCLFGFSPYAPPWWSASLLSSPPGSPACDGAAWRREAGPSRWSSTFAPPAWRSGLEREGRPEGCPSYWTHGWALSADRQSTAV